MPSDRLTMQRDIHAGEHRSAPVKTAQGPSVSVIVPTRNERQNVEPLLARVASSTIGMQVELIFVDDSTDDTPDVARRAAAAAPFPVHVISRPPERRNGLGKAVVEGMNAATHDWICVIDGDLQHPPEVIPQLLDAAEASASTLVAASRFAKGGDTEGLPLHRKLISQSLILISRLVFPARLRRVSDPMTGFFVVRRDALDTRRLDPEGFKILLEVLVRTPGLLVSEVPFEFAERHAGESKANSAEAFRLFRQIFRLVVGAQIRFSKFVAVGAAGMAVNTALMAFFAEVFALHYLVAAVLATQGSTASNFALSEAWVFRDRASREARWRRAGYYVGLNNTALILRGPMIVLLVAFGLHYVWANLVSLIVMTVIRYVLSDRVIWGSVQATPLVGTMHESAPVIVPSHAVQRARRQ